MSITDIEERILQQLTEIQERVRQREIERRNEINLINYRRKRRLHAMRAALEFRAQYIGTVTQD